MAVPIDDGLAEVDRVAFRASASRPMRIGVHLRSAENGGEPMPWVRSVYLDSTPRDIVLPLEEFRTAGDVDAGPPLDQVRALLFVADTVNAQTGTNGRVIVSGVRAERVAE